MGKQIAFIEEASLCCTHYCYIQLILLEEFGAEGPVFPLDIQETSKE